MNFWHFPRSHKHVHFGLLESMFFAFFGVLVLSPLIVRGSKKKEHKAALEILDKIKGDLKKNGNSICNLKEITERHIDQKRLTEQAEAAIPCMVKYILANVDNGFQWSALGSTLKRCGKPLSNYAESCFKQAAKYVRYQTHISDWSFLGPFVIGKTEFDGDPVEAFGGIRNVSRYRYHKMKYATELITGGEVKWKRFQQTSPEMFLKIIPDINWNDLVSSLGSLAITEWQGWLVGEFSVSNKNVNLLVQCLGVPVFYIDNITFPGEVYKRDHYWNLVDVAPGIHTLYMLVRTKAVANVQCAFKETKSSFGILEPRFLPDIVNEHILGTYLSLPVSNYHSTKSLMISKITVKTEEQEQLTSRLLDSNFSIKPGQIRPVLLNITDRTTFHTDCETVELDLKLLTSAGLTSFSLSLRCRKLRESFLYTFLDHDGSVQHAAAIYPLHDCLRGLCPIVLSLHGTTVPPQSQADSYKHMVDGEFLFGVKGAWLLAPTRHGAHNWEGPGLLTALTAVDALEQLTVRSEWLEQKASAKDLIYAGHSMGGHGVWHLASHYPDNALAVISQAGWIKKEEYGDSNLFFRHDIATSHTDPAVKFIMECCIAENDADRHISNMKGLSVLARIGEEDRTVHPFYMRRMNRLLIEHGINVTYTELPGKEHWWWDTRYTNDGGVTNDNQIRDFILEHIRPERNGDSCSIDSGCDGQKNRYVKQNPIDSFTVTTFNPALGDTVYGLQILQQITPYRESSITCTLEGVVELNTRNVYRFSIGETGQRTVHWKERKIKIDGQITLEQDKLADVLSGKKHLCNKKGKWEFCDTDYDNYKQRSPKQMGPARRIAEAPLIIITGTSGSTETTDILRQLAVFIANLFFLTSEAYVPVVTDLEIEQDVIEKRNIIIIGSPLENKYAEQFLQHIPLKIKDNEIILEGCTFRQSQTGVMSLAPNGRDHLALLLMGNSIDGLRDVVSLAKPTIPPMTRSPFSNLLPDFVITGPEFLKKGPGGFACAGFWGNKWEYRYDTVSCVC